MKKCSVNKYTYLGLLAMLCVVFASCSTTKPEDFEEFYQKFTTDEAFQLSRIEFPLEGCETDNDTIIYWKSPEDWYPITISAYDIDTTEFTVEKSYAPANVEIKVYIPNSGFGVTQEFELIEGKWYLVFYDSMST